MLITNDLSHVNCESVKRFQLSSGEITFPGNREGILEITIKNPPPIREVFFHGEHLKEYIPEPQVFFGRGYGKFGVAFNIKRQTPEDAVQAFYSFAEKYWVNKEVDI